MPMIATPRAAERMGRIVVQVRCVPLGSLLALIRISGFSVGMGWNSQYCIHSTICAQWGVMSLTMLKVAAQGVMALFAALTLFLVGTMVMKS